MLPGGICVSFAGSPELAAKDIWKFAKLNPNGADFSVTVEFFEQSSKVTNNDYIVAFAKNPKIVKIANGERQAGLSKTLWIGDKSAYEAFRAQEARAKKKYERGRAISGVLMANELPDSASSELYSAMRHVALSREVPTVGGFVSLVSNIEEGFRHPCLSDMLFDWPVDASPDFDLQLTDKITFGASGENEGYSISQFATGYGDFSFVGFYLLRGRLAYIFHPTTTLMADKCTVIRDVSPVDLPAKLTEAFKTDYGWLVWIASPSPDVKVTSRRVADKELDGGIQLGFMMECNTFPPPDKPQMLPALNVFLPGPTG